MIRARRRERVRITPYVEAYVAQRLSEYSAASGLSASMIVQAALLAHLDRTGDTTLLLRRFDRLGRALERAHRDLDFFGEAFGVFVRLWFAYTPQIPEDAKDGARRSSEARFAQFIEHVVERFSGSPRFFDDLPREILADDAELNNAVAAPNEPPGHVRDAGARGSDDEE
jgi:hypothetical protein